MYVCMCVYVYMYVYVDMSMYMCACVCVYVCAHTCLHWLSKGFALATQESWIQFDAIQDNILSRKTFDAQLYRKVQEAYILHDNLRMGAWL